MDDVFACLPDEVLERVLSSLSPADLVACRAVSRRWRRAVAELEARDVPHWFDCGAADVAALHGGPLDRLLERNRDRERARVAALPLPCTCGAVLVTRERLVALVPSGDDSEDGDEDGDEDGNEERDAVEDRGGDAAEGVPSGGSAGNAATATVARDDGHGRHRRPPHGHPAGRARKILRRTRASAPYALTHEAAYPLARWALLAPQRALAMHLARVAGALDARAVVDSYQSRTPVARWYPVFLYVPPDLARPPSASAAAFSAFAAYLLNGERAWGPGQEVRNPQGLRTAWERAAAVFQANAADPPAAPTAEAIWFADFRANLGSAFSRAILGTAPPSKRAQRFPLVLEGEWKEAWRTVSALPQRDAHPGDRADEETLHSSGQVLVADFEDTYTPEFEADYPAYNTHGPSPTPEQVLETHDPSSWSLLGYRVRRAVAQWRYHCYHRRVWRYMRLLDMDMSPPFGGHSTLEKMLDYLSGQVDALDALEAAFRAACTVSAWLPPLPSTSDRRVFAVGLSPAGHLVGICAHVEDMPRFY